MICNLLYYKLKKLQNPEGNVLTLNLT